MFSLAEKSKIRALRYFGLSFESTFKSNLLEESINR